MQAEFDRAHGFEPVKPPPHNPEIFSIPDWHAAQRQREAIDALTAVGSWRIDIMMRGGRIKTLFIPDSTRAAAELFVRQFCKNPFCITVAVDRFRLSNGRSSNVDAKVI